MLCDTVRFVHSVSLGSAEEDVIRIARPGRDNGRQLVQSMKLEGPDLLIELVAGGTVGVPRTNIRWFVPVDEKKPKA